ncbi:Alpha-hemolysin translocation ATP-binding protein HlyB [Aggregatibacter actinomycetemcomitans]|uniref:type I secretion system permease/ATPase n=1 Tax=Aggregatibacter actinomycetemcomitans TaxID=714 RepID=UPI0001B9F1F0|nr:type I secretion system permease/ATPase [Aggregatibacter actinomycetemcomitans]ACX83179.1 peptidase C39 [Aggregatibacter actinomycetemcomitans D11S-1]KOE58705.1 peptidase C39 [Aggregatibacter actinomycetemcomitans serotype c str. AAS4A]KOE60761.1 peptidase C39 [Aggregatibacter actinomycetemcomitans serotype c str. SCC2302]KOE61556.1 peptidase C39 [Aggregatibacter actinomycetemcomitans serotype c str. D17P-2]KYK72409.1 peptidase C39 [Aggregatibacter actinomycetemcomitans serotype e str. SA21
MDSQKNTNLALQALEVLAQYHNISINPEEIKHKFDIDGHGLNQTKWLLAARSLGLKVRTTNKTIDRLPFLHLPVLAWRDDGDHFILLKIDQETDRYLIFDLMQKNPIVLDKNEFEERYQSKVILVASRASIVGNLAKFDFTWFIPAVIKYRRIFIETLIVSIFLQIFALITPLFFQVVMDKVLVHRGFSTLNVITVALAIVVLFEIVLGGLRTYVFAHSTSRIDVELGARLFRHLLALPISYFEARRVGDTVARVRELDQIRNFLTGQALTSILDLLFSFIFFAVMWYYSPKLTLVVLGSLPCYVIWSVFISPILRRRLDDKFARNADNQSFLVESVTAINTIKAMAISPQMTNIWDKQLASYVAASFKVTVLATIGQQGIQLIQKAVMVINLWLGAHLVISGDLSIGQLIAFNMLAGQIISPVIRLAQIWQDFQQVGISVTRLGDVLNSPTENNTASVSLPEIQGEISFRNIKFRYKPDSPMILNNINLDISQGEVIGIVGRSGSGKSTLTKLIQRFYIPEQGQVLIDGHDLALADPNWLRRQVGVVLQDNVLLNRSIRENIALTNPGMPMEKVIAAAKLAGAHDFISELREGYNTVVGEQGAGLSGGQRQRIAIARALVNNPRILIFDEATSALDYESENIIMHNMHKICQNRTVLIIAHRLSTVKNADRIIVMDKGEIIEQGKHQELLKDEKGFYSYLHQLQVN